MTLVDRRRLGALLTSACHAAPWLLGATGVHAQAVPDAGSILQRVEPERGVRPPPPAAAPAPAAPAVDAAPSTLSLTVSRFRFTGNRLLGAEELTAATAGFTGRPVTFAQLQEAAAAAAAAYRRAGWVVSVQLPPQEVEDGVVTLNVVEAGFGAVHLEAQPGIRVPAARALATVSAAQTAGQPVRGDAIDRALLLVDDLPGVTAAGSLQAGRRDGETDLALRLGPDPLVSGDAAIDNTGSRPTGSVRALGNLQGNSLLGLGDRWGLTALGARGIRYLRGSAGVPVGFDGWRLGAHASALHYEVVTDAFAALDIRGRSTSAGLEAHYPLLRSRMRNVYTGLHADRKRFDNRAAAAVTSRYRIDSVAASLAANAVHVLGGADGGTEALAVLTHGRVDLRGSPNEAAVSATTRASGRFTKLRLGAAAQQSLGGRWSASVQLAGQVANRNLDSAEKFYLGGAGGVRAYPTSEAGGARGHLVNLELQARLGHGLTLSGFYDHGAVTVNVDNTFAGAAQPNRLTLQGAGLALRWQSASGGSVKLTWARRIGDNPQPAASGSDQDGTLRRNRIWLVASHSF